jgi:hypothetical protein
MAFWNPDKDKAALARLEDEAYHAAAVQEIESGKRRDGLWAMAAIESEGNEVKAKIAYLRLLVVAIRDDHYFKARMAEEATIRSKAAYAMDQAAAKANSRSAQSKFTEELRSQQWHYYSFGKKYGPINGIELRYHIKTQTIRSEDKVIGPGMSEWIQAAAALRLLEPN